MPSMQRDEKISGLANLGPKSQDMLARAGITTVAQLRHIGAVVAYARVKQADANESLNLLWALESQLRESGGNGRGTRPRARCPPRRTGSHFGSGR